MLEICKDLFSQWNDNGIRYCHWKSNEHLTEGLDGITDLDVLLDAADKKRGCTVLQELCFLYCKSQFGSRYPFVEDWIGFDLATGTLIHLHLHYKMITGHKGMKEYTLPWTDDVLSTRVLDKATNVFISDPNYEIFTLFSRFGLKAHYKQIKKAKTISFTIGQDNKKEIAYLRERVEWQKVSSLVKEYYHEDSDLLLNIMKKQEISGEDFLCIKRLAEKNLKNYKRYSSIDVFIRSIYYHLSGYIQRFRKHFGVITITRKTPSLGRGLIIAIMGQDGAGKSTVVKDIRKWLSWKLEVSQFYLGSGDHYQPWEKRLAEKLHRSNNPIAKLIRKWLPFSYFSRLGEHVYKTIVKANKYAFKGGIVLFDRYPQVKYVGINDGPKIRQTIMKKATGALRFIADYYARREEKYIRKAVAYSPDVVIKLMLPPEESIRRKPHENYELVKQKHEIIKSLEFDGAFIYTVDATQPYGKELIEIKNIIWEHIFNNRKDVY